MAKLRRKSQRALFPLCSPASGGRNTGREHLLEPEEETQVEGKQVGEEGGKMKGLRKSEEEEG